MENELRFLKKVFSGVLIIVSAALISLSVYTLVKSHSNDTPEPKAREAIGYAIVNGKRYDITRYATNNGHPYVWTTDGTQIIGAGITVFIPDN